MERKVVYCQSPAKNDENTEMIFSVHTTEGKDFPFFGNVELLDNGKEESACAIVTTSGMARNIASKFLEMAETLKKHEEENKR